MGNHNDNAVHNIVTTYKKNIENQFRNGLAQGMYASCKVILDKARDERMSVDDRITDIANFCETITKKRGSDSGGHEGEVNK